MILGTRISYAVVVIRGDHEDEGCVGDDRELFRFEIETFEPSRMVAVKVVAVQGAAIGSHDQIGGVLNECAKVAAPEVDLLKSHTVEEVDPVRVA